MNIEKLKGLINDDDIEVITLQSHSKASELYVEVAYYDRENNFIWSGLIPYHYRRTALFIESEETLSEYLIEIKPYFKKGAIREWIKQEKKLWRTKFKGKYVTKPFFDELAKMKWTSNFPPNDNPQRRIQDIKELGYTIGSRRYGRKTERVLIPIPRGGVTGYEVMSAEFKEKAIKVLDSMNSYELSSVNRAGLIPDHKFPEIRWDMKTREENSKTMLETDIKSKFQLLDNQRNQQKREVCRNCFQTGKRGFLFGIKYFYEGDEKWPNEVPRIGKNAEQGCVGCGWYDIQKWRLSLNELIKSL